MLTAPPGRASRRLSLLLCSLALAAAADARAGHAPPLVMLEATEPALTGGLDALSAPELEAAEPSGTAVPPPRLDPAAWLGGSDLGQALARHRARFAAQRDDAAALLDLARLDLAWQRGREGLAALATLGELAPARRAHADVMLLEGALAVLAGRPEQALARLREPGLVDLAEAELWRGAGLFLQGDVAEALPALRHGRTELERYPAPLRARLGLLGLEAALAADPGGVRPWLDLAVAAAPAGEALVQLDYLRARLAWRDGRRDAARAGLQHAAAAPVGLRPRVLARLALLELDQAEGHDDPAVAAEELARLAYLWDEGPLGQQIRERLAAARAAAGAPAAALAALREASRLAGAGAAALREQALGLLQALVDAALAGASDPLAAIVRLDEYRDLLPADGRRDALDEAAARTLAALDLPEAAATRLARQLETGPDERRAQLVVELARLRLAAGAAQDALTALDRSEPDPVDPTLARQRLRLRVEALRRLGRPAEALRALGPADPALDPLRAELAWEAGDWAAAAAWYAKLADPDRQGSIAATERSLLRAAAALRLAGDTAGLAALRVRLAGRLEPGQAATDLARLTEPDGGAEALANPALLARLAATPPPVAAPGVSTARPAPPRP